MTVTDITTRAPTDGDRTPPHDIDAEQVVLGAAIEHPATLADITEILTPLDFYRPAHQIIFETVLDMAQRGRPLGAVAVNAELTRRGDITRVGGGVYLHTLTEVVPVAANGAYYATIVADLAGKRRLVEAGTRITQIGYDGQGDVDDLQEHANATLTQAIAATTTREDDTWRLGDNAMDFLTHLDTPIDDRALVSAPYRDLSDHLTGGFKNGELICVAGRTGAGKSIVGLDAARHAAITLGLPTLYVSLEMPVELVRERVYSAQGKVPLHTIKEHELTERDWERVAQAHPAIVDAPLYIATPPRCTLALLRQRVQTMIRRGTEIRMLVVDHVGLMATSGRTESRYNEVSAFARGLKQLAMECDIPVLMLCQVNRGAGQRTDQVPRLSDLRDSGELEQSSDVVVMVHREDYDVADKQSPRAGEVDLFVAKNRSGATGVVTVAGQLHYTRCVDMAAR